MSMTYQEMRIELNEIDKRIKRFNKAEDKIAYKTLLAEIETTYGDLHAH